MDIVKIHDLRVRTEVGFSAHEVGTLQELSITLQLKTSIKKAGETDREEDTINYRTKTKDVLFHVANKKYNLIEAVATDVARICVVRWGVPLVKVTVKKPNSLRFAESSSVTIERRWEDFDWHEAHISIGSNKNPLQNVLRALSLLKKKVEIIKLSKTFWTKAVRTKPGTNDFVNMAVVVKTKLDVGGLKQVLLAIERQLGRTRQSADENADIITLDFDISFWGNNIMEYSLDCKPAGTSWLTPHPDTLKYAHMIIPMADVTPEFIHPQENKSLRTMAVEVSGRQDFWSFFSTVDDEDFQQKLKILDGTSKRENYKTNYLSMKTVNRGLEDEQPIDSLHVSNGTSNGIEHCVSREARGLEDDQPIDSLPQTNGIALSTVHLDTRKARALEDDKPRDSLPLTNGITSVSTEHREARDAPVALVTGAAKRLGACTARKLHAAGFRVVIHYNKSESDSKDLLRELNSIRSNSASLTQGDLTCDVSRTARRIISEAVGAWGRLDALVNNASQFYPTHLGSVTEEVWDDMIQANLTSPFFLSQAAYPSLKESNGTIINLCDIHAERPKTSHSVYCISKAGLHMCTFSMAKEFAPHVRVNGVAPGYILWPEDSLNGASSDSKKFLEKEKLQQQQESIRKIPFGRKGEPDNIADAVVFLAKSAEYITGQIIAVDGGRSLHQ